MTRALWARRLGWAWAALLVIGLSWPGDKIPSMTLLTRDKVIHAALFGVLFLLFVQGSRRPWRTALGCAAFGALSEVWQHLLPFGRYGDVFDALANVVGVLTAWFGYWAVSRWRRRSPDGHGSAQDSSADRRT